MSQAFFRCRLFPRNRAHSRERSPRQAIYASSPLCVPSSIETTRELGRKYGLLVGISSGANVYAARKLASKIKGNIATVLPDRAERYFSTALM